MKERIMVKKGKKKRMSSNYKRKGILGRRVFSNELETRIDEAVPQVARMAGVSKNFARNTLGVIFAADAYMQIDEISKEGLSTMQVCRECLDPHVGFPDGSKCINCGGELVRRPGFASKEIEITQNVELEGGGDASSKEGEAVQGDLPSEH
jgi:hypothetical protein